MATRNTKTMLDKMKLTDEYIGAVVVNYGQGIMTIDDYYELNEKYVEVICRVLQRPWGDAVGGV